MISTEEEYKQAFIRLDKIWDSDNENEEELLYLVDEIEKYEDIHYPIPKPNFIIRLLYKLGVR